MGYAIRVQANSECLQAANPNFFVKNFNTAEEFQSAVDLCDNKRRIGTFESWVITVRTNNFNNFCKDFFLPALINRALKFNDIALKIIFVVVLTIVDVCTLPLRVITIIPRYFYNAAHPKEAHLFYNYLIENGVAKENLAIDYVYLELEWIEGPGGFPPGFESRYHRNQVIQGETFNFIQLPVTASNIREGLARKGISDPGEPLTIEEA